jgi:PmbA protein
MERDYDYSSATHAEDLASPESLGAKAAKLTLGRLNPQAMRTGKMPVVFDPRVARRIVGYFLSGINGASVARGTSFLRDAMKTQIFAPGITIHMDPFRKRGLASSPFDAEGVAHQAMNLIEDGMLTTWLLDLRSAHQLGLKTNGCASRGLTSAPSPSAQNVHLEAGRLSPEELMADIKDGVYITETFGTGVNLTTGDFSQGAAGIRIENGKLTYPVSEFTIAGHLKDMFASLTPANDLAFLHSLNAPTLRVGEMMVAGQ